MCEMICPSCHRKAMRFSEFDAKAMILSVVMCPKCDKPFTVRHWLDYNNPAKPTAGERMRAAVAGGKKEWNR